MNNNLLMTGPEGNSEFCFPEILNVPLGLGETKLTVSRGASHQVFCYTSQDKTREKTAKKSFA